MQFIYTISFTATGLDERKFRQSCERLGATEVSITRSRQGTSAQSRNEIEEAIKSILEDDMPHRRRDIIEAIRSRGLSYRGVDQALGRLVAAGEIVCFKHGLYGSLRTSVASATALPPRINKLKKASSFTRVVELIQNQPQTAVVLREKVQVSRQRMEQILKKAESRNLIRRVPTEFGEKGRYAYISETAAISEIENRKSTLLERRKQLLSSMAPDTLYSARQLAAHFDVPITLQIKEALAELSRLGLVKTLAVGIKVFCSLTSAGAVHNDYITDAPKAPRVDLVAEIGEIKSRFLQALRALGGAARTIDLTSAVLEPRIDGSRTNSGQMMQMLEEVGLVHRPKKRDIRQTAYSLTETGQQVAALLDRYIHPPERSALELRIAQRAEIRSNTMRQIADISGKRKAKQI